MSWMSIFYIFFGGGFGSVIRYLISLFFVNYSFPIATLLANFVSCICLASILFCIQKWDLNDSIKMFFIIGFCGGLSTFSTFSYETLNLFKTGDVTYALFSVLFNVLLCLTVLYFLVKEL